MLRRVLPAALTTFLVAGCHSSHLPDGGDSSGADERTAVLSEPAEPPVFLGDLTCCYPKRGIVLAISDKVNLVLISIPDGQTCEEGQTVAVHRGSTRVSTLVADKSEDGWAACREQTELRVREIQQGDWVDIEEPE